MAKSPDKTTLTAFAPGVDAFMQDFLKRRQGELAEQGNKVGGGSSVTPPSAGPALVMPAALKSRMPDPPPMQVGDKVAGGEIVHVGNDNKPTSRTEKILKALPGIGLSMGKNMAIKAGLIAIATPVLGPATPVIVCSAFMARGAWKLGKTFNKIKDQLSEKQNEFKQEGMGNAQAFFKALNEDKIAVGMIASSAVMMGAAVAFGLDDLADNINEGWENAKDAVLGMVGGSTPDAMNGAEVSKFAGIINGNNNIAEPVVLDETAIAHGGIDVDTEAAEGLKGPSDYDSPKEYMDAVKRGEAEYVNMRSGTNFSGASGATDVEGVDVKVETLDAVATTEKPSGLNIVDGVAVEAGDYIEQIGVPGSRVEATFTDGMIRVVGDGSVDMGDPVAGAHVTYEIESETLTIIDPNTGVAKSFVVDSWDAAASELPSHPDLKADTTGMEFHSHLSEEEYGASYAVGRGNVTLETYDTGNTETGIVSVIMEDPKNPGSNIRIDLSNDAVRVAKISPNGVVVEAVLDKGGMEGLSISNKTISAPEQKWGLNGSTFGSKPPSK